ncbi:Uncharacterised protein [Amycolatopsis camponoti]|uniref:Uncharacterized protein n=1 Tax=Amycolatopsis camponoti TaxID=2606593 RepID=A0A6I8M0E3_9PSEU|nr:Uncharacterised protein [Amycolatopsis camponoti]
MLWISLRRPARRRLRRQLAQIHEVSGPLGRSRKRSDNTPAKRPRPPVRWPSRSRGRAPWAAGPARRRVGEQPPRGWGRRPGGRRGDSASEALSGPASPARWCRPASRGSRAGHRAHRCRDGSQPALHGVGSTVGSSSRRRRCSRLVCLRRGGQRAQHSDLAAGADRARGRGIPARFPACTGLNVLATPAPGYRLSRSRALVAPLRGLAMRHDVPVTRRLSQTVRRLVGRCARPQAGRPPFNVE